MMTMENFCNVRDCFIFVQENAHCLPLSGVCWRCWRWCWCEIFIYVISFRPLQIETNGESNNLCFSFYWFTHARALVRHSNHILFGGASTRCARYSIKTHKCISGAQYESINMPNAQELLRVLPIRRNFDIVWGRDAMSEEPEMLYDELNGCYGSRKHRPNTWNTHFSPIINKRRKFPFHAAFATYS